MQFTGVSKTDEQCLESEVDLFHRVREKKGHRGVSSGLPQQRQRKLLITERNRVCAANSLVMEKTICIWCQCEIGTQP